MNCHYCRGQDTYESTTTRVSCHSVNQPYYVENLPVLECIQCGEQLFSEEVMDVLDKIDNGEARSIRMEPVQVYDFRNLKGVANRLLSESAWLGCQGRSHPVEND